MYNPRGVSTIHLWPLAAPAESLCLCGLAAWDAWGNTWKSRRLILLVTKVKDMLGRGGEDSLMTRLHVTVQKTTQGKCLVHGLTCKHWHLTAGQAVQSSVGEVKDNKGSTDLTFKCEKAPTVCLVRHWSDICNTTHTQEQIKFTFHIRSSVIRLWESDESLWHSIHWDKSKCPKQLKGLLLILDPGLLSRYGNLTCSSRTLMRCRWFLSSSCSSEMVSFRATICCFLSSFSCSQ